MRSRLVLLSVAVTSMVVIAFSLPLALLILPGFVLLTIGPTFLTAVDRLDL